MSNLAHTTHNLLAEFGTFALKLPRSVKRITALSADAASSALAVWLSFSLRLGEWVTITEPITKTITMSICLAAPIYITSGLYRSIFRFNGVNALLTVFKASLIYGICFMLVVAALNIPGVPRTIGIIQPVILLFFVGGSRALISCWLGDKYRTSLKKLAKVRILIFGAGIAGRQLGNSLAESSEVLVVGFLDDDEALEGKLLNGIPIYHSSGVGEIIEKLRVEMVVLAMPQLDRNRRLEVSESLKALGVSVRTLPSLADIVQGRVSLTALREFDIYDLLGREPATPNPLFLSEHTLGKTVLITGAGGSIGSELCRQVISQKPKQLILLEQSEIALYQIQQELEGIADSHGVTVKAILGSVLDKARIQKILSDWRPDTIYHAAAYKHVLLVEKNPIVGIQTNSFGTLIIAEAAIKYGVTNFVLISTDKAVRPASVMGASKRLAELILQALASTQSTTTFSIVRFGNVLDSSGSVVPKFLRQIRAGGPITLTHPDVSRYFMTIPEAAQLVIQAASMGGTGDVFILDMGSPVKVADLAKRMVELSGLKLRTESDPQGDINIEITGLSPGEKLHEELSIEGNPINTAHPNILRVTVSFIPWTQLQAMLGQLEATLDSINVSAALGLLEKIISGLDPCETALSHGCQTVPPPLPVLQGQTQTR